LKKTALLVLKLAFGIAVFELVLRRIDLAKSVALIHEARPFPLAAAFLSVALSNVLIVSRWKAILDATGFRVPFGRLTAVNLVGIFLSNFLPGSVAGDVVKVFYIVTPQQSGRVMSATFLSRVVGMLATFLLGLLAFPFAAASFKAQPWWAACALALALGAVGSAGLLFPGPDRVVVFLLGFLAVPGRTLRLVADLLEPVRLWRSQPRAVAKTAVLAVLFQIAGPVLVLTFCARALGIELPLLSAAVIASLANVAFALPLSLNGLGIAEALYVVLLTPLGASGERAFLAALLVRLVLTSQALVGGAFYFGLKGVRQERLGPYRLELPLA